MSRILVLRFSAMGDVAMTLPVVFSVAQSHADDEFVVVSRQNFAPIYGLAPANVRFFGIDMKKYAGLGGLNRLYRELHAMHFDAVADLHDVLRTKFLRKRFRLGGARVAHIDKGHRQKRALTRQRNKKFAPLATSFDRYKNVFAQLGLDAPLRFRSVFDNQNADFSELEKKVGTKAAGWRWLGIAPFAKHEGKIYPPALMRQVAQHFDRRGDTRIFLFGGGKQETEQLRQMADGLAHCTICAGMLTLPQEMQLMSRLDAMISMDSANMHLASLAGTPVVSVWGATHPYAGFLGWRQSEDDTAQTDMACRPCSVFGDKPCRFGTYACMHGIAPETVARKAEEIFARK